MKRVKFLLSVETYNMCHSCVFQRASITHWKMNAPRILVPQIGYRLLCMPTGVFNSCSTGIVKCYHLYPKSRELAAIARGISLMNNIQPTTHAEMIKQYFDVSRTTAYRMLERNESLRSFDVHSLARNMNTLQEYRVDTEEVRNNPVLLYRCPLTVEHSIAVMKELGLQNLTTEHFAHFKKFMKTNVAIVKRWGLLAKHYDPLEVLASLGVPQQVLSDVKFEDNINNLSLEKLHHELSSVYLSWCLGYGHEELGKIQRTYRLAKKSMRLQQAVLDQLKYEWNFTASKICQNGYLLTCSPVNISLIDKKVQHIAGIDVKEYASWTPRILTIPYHHLLQVCAILSKLPISKASLKTLPRICTLHPDTLEKRVNYLKENSEFSVLQSHPRMLHLLFYHKKINSRLDLLLQAKKSNMVPSLNKLSGAKHIFHKYMKVGDLRQSRKDIVLCLSAHFSVTPSDIRKCLHRHCWGSQTTIINVQRNLFTLKDEGFTVQQLMTSLDVVLYPPDLVQYQLMLLPRRPQLQPFSEFKSKANVLQHLLYFMEKNPSLTSVE